MLAELYGGQELAGLGLTNYDYASQIFHPASLPFNILRSAVDTLQARIAKEKVRPYFLTDKGNAKQIKRAKSLQRFCDGIFDKLQVYRKTPWCFRDALIFGTGLMMVYRRGDQLFIERIFPWEALLDLSDARYGNPKCLYLIRYIDRDVMIDMFPDMEEELKSVGISTEDVDHVSDVEQMTDKVTVIEAWHLPSGPNATDGRHAVVVDNCTLIDEQYDKHYFPIAMIKFKEPIAGTWGSGLGRRNDGLRSGNKRNERQGPAGTLCHRWTDLACS